MGSSGETEEASGPERHPAALSPAFPPPGHCNLRTWEERGPERPGLSEAPLLDTWHGHPRPAQHPCPSYHPKTASPWKEKRPPTPPEGPRSLATVTRPQALKKKRKGRWRDGRGRGEKRLPREGWRREEEGREQGWGAWSKSGRRRRSGVRGGRRDSGGDRGSQCSCPPSLPPSLSFMILKQPSSLG